MVVVLLSIIFADWSAVREERAVPDSVAEPIRKALDAKAVIVKDGNEEKLAFWFRSSIPSSTTKEQVKNGLTFRELPETVVVGVVTIVKPFVDYRKQEIAAGTYTLRLGFQPENGDHMGTAPHAEFLLLSPVDTDKSLDETDLKTVVGWSKKATGGDHPGVMLLFPYRGDKDEPEIDSREGNVKIVTVRRTVRADGKDVIVGFGITIAGFSKTR